MPWCLRLSTGDFAALASVFLQWKITHWSQSAQGSPGDYQTDCIIPPFSVQWANKMHFPDSFCLFLSHLQKPIPPPVSLNPPLHTPSTEIVQSWWDSFPSTLAHWSLLLCIFLTSSPLSSMVVTKSGVSLSLPHSHTWQGLCCHISERGVERHYWHPVGGCRDGAEPPPLQGTGQRSPQVNTHPALKSTGLKNKL